MQFDKNGKAGDVQDKTIPKLNAPIVAKKEIHRQKPQIEVCVYFLYILFWGVLKMSQNLIKHISTNFLNFGTKFQQSLQLF